MDSSLPHTGPAIGPRPKLKTIRIENGVKVSVCESLEEMNIRISGLRKRGDKRSADRILADYDDTRARAQKGIRRIGTQSKE